MNKTKRLKRIGVILFAVIVFLIPIVDGNTYHHLILCQTLVNLVIVLGLNFITGLTGQMNLGTAGIMALGAYTAALGSTKFGIPVWGGFVLTIIVGLIIGKALGYPSLRLKGVYLSLTTIGFSEVVRLILTNAADFTGGTMGVRDIPWISIFGIELNTPFRAFFLYYAIAAVLTFTAYRVVKSKWGRVFKAIRDNIEAVEASGIDVAKMKILAFTLATVLGCLGGTMYAHLMGYINPTTFTQDLSVNYLAMMMLGGIGSVAGNIIGSVIVTIVPEVLRFMENYYWLTFSAIALLFAIFLPNGIVSLFSKDKPLGRFWRKKKGEET